MAFSPNTGNTSKPESLAMIYAGPIFSLFLLLGNKVFTFLFQ